MLRRVTGGARSRQDHHPADQRRVHAGSRGRRPSRRNGAARHAREGGCARRIPTRCFLIAGDFLSPSVLSTYLKGRQMIATLNAIGLDVATFGNHEFDFGPACSSSACANRASRGSLERPRPAHRERVRRRSARPAVTLGGIRVGLLGLTLAETAHASSPRARRRLRRPAARGRGDRQTRSACAARNSWSRSPIRTWRRPELGEKAAIDLIVGGHEHEPLVAEAGRAIVIKAGSDARYLVQIDLWLTRDGPSRRALVDVPRGQRAHRAGPRRREARRAYSTQLDRELAGPVGPHRGRARRAARASCERRRRASAISSPTSCAKR